MVAYSSPTATTMTSRTNAENHQPPSSRLPRKRPKMTMPEPIRIARSELAACSSAS
jgi:hypothetical protein